MLDKQIERLACMKLNEAFKKIYPDYRCMNYKMHQSTYSEGKDGWYSYNYEIDGNHRQLIYYFRNGAIEEETVQPVKKRTSYNSDKNFSKEELIQLIIKFGEAMYYLSNAEKLNDINVIARYDNEKQKIFEKIVDAL